MRCGWSYDPNEPCFFFGLYTGEDYMRFALHSGEKVLIFGGSDAFGLPEKHLTKDGSHYGELRKFSKKGVVVSISRDIQNELKSVGIDSVYYPVCPTDDVKFPLTTTRGKDVVYVYARDNRLVEWEMVSDVIDLCKSNSEIKFHIVTGEKFINPLDMDSLYDECFIGWKPYKRDGFGNTQVELALKGRLCISNGDLETNLGYNSAEDVANAIMLAYENRRTHDGYLYRCNALSEIEQPNEVNEYNFWTKLKSK